QDGGRNWRPVYQCVTKAEVDGLMRQIGCNFWKLRYATPSVVYALGAAIEVTAAVVVKSVDGGASWSAVAVLPDENGTEGGLFFVDENTGYLSTKDAKSAYRTTDGGATWSGMPATSIGRRMIFADPSVGWAMYYARLSYTTDGGKRWSSRDLPLPAMPNAFSLPRRDRGYVVGDHGMIYRYTVLPETAPVAAKALPAPAMPALDNAVLAQMDKLEAGLERLDTIVASAGSASGAAAEGGDWSDAAVDQQLAQLQSTIDAVATGGPTLGSKHRNLNLLMVGLQLLGDLTGQGNGLKEAFNSLRQSKDLATASSALQNLHGTLVSMRTSVESFQSARKPGG
ncbi:MAG: WD40/YVTN/BNR-like repeat-containing protein, partial [Gammaproteobacteria bacterium]